MAERGASGRIEGDAHLFPVRVYWEDTDAGGIVYYANYLKFTERARSDLLRGLGVDQQAMLGDGEGAMFAVRDVTIEYLSPARLDDDLVVATRLVALKGATITLDQDVLRGGEALVRSRVRAAFIGLGGRPRRIPTDIRQAMEGLAARGEEEES
ncbi:MAG: tol-pal system-associated acyl-CoA thioesterase [Minwuia sp.]|uniref:tol-pal system-associated acyl-CoA thioesterase n=1 Tax=Minwuia sp. TaxID=2493630 RepID=UPI003A8A5D8E